MTRAVPLSAAAAELGVGESTLRRWVERGCPVTHRGRRSRAACSLFDVDAIRQWRDAADHPDTFVLKLAAELPTLLADAIDAAFRDTDRPDKRELVAGVLAAAWYATSAAALDRLREDVPRVPELTARDVPDSIRRLQMICHDAR